MTKHVIEIDSERYLFNNNEVSLESIPAGVDYACYKLNRIGEPEYFELRRGSKTHRIMSVCDSEDYLPRVEAVLAHALASGMQTDDLLEVGIIIDSDQFNLQVPVSETEQCSAMARFKVSLNSKEPTIESNGFMVEVGATEPMPLMVKRIYYDDGRQLIHIEYVLYSLTKDLLLDTRYSFIEVSTLGESLARKIDDTAKTDSDRQKYYMPVCDAEYLNEVSSFVNLEHVAHIDFEGNSITDEEMMDTAAMYNRSFCRQWYNDKHELRMNQIIMLQGIAHTEIFSVPQEKHVQSVHAYLRRVHRKQELISLDYGKATHFVVMYEPFSKVSSEVVPLQSGQYKRHSSIYSTLQSEESIILVGCECIVFDSNDKPIKKFSFERPGEQQLKQEKIL